VNNFSRRPKSKLSREALANKQTSREGAVDPPSLGSLPFFFSYERVACRLPGQAELSPIVMNKLERIEKVKIKKTGSQGGL